MKTVNCLSLLLLGVSLVACDRGTGGTSKSGPANQTVDSDFRVHRDKDGSVAGRPGVSPYQGRMDQSKEGQMPGVAASPSAPVKPQVDSGARR